MFKRLKFIKSNKRKLIYANVEKRSQNNNDLNST